MRHIGFLFIAILIACNAEVPEDTQSLLSRIITKQDDALLRGVSLGMTPDEVKSKEESAALTEDVKDYLFYEVQHDSLNSFTVSYSFERNKLIEIRVDVYTFNDVAASDLCKEIVDAFAEDYKARPSEFAGLWRWSANFNEIASIIELRDESADYNNVGKVTLLVYMEPTAEV